MSNARYQALAGRLESQAASLRCVRGVPVNDSARRAISTRYRRVMNVLMRQAREAFAQARGERGAK